MYRPGGYYFGRKWEQTATSNLGIDYGFLDNRITGSIDVYYKKTTDLLNEIEQSAGTNFSNRVVANVGDMENRGVEFSISSDVIRKKDVNWSVAFNATFNKNEITKLTQVPNPSSPGNRVGGISGGTGQSVQINSVGYARNIFYVYQQVYNADGTPLDGVFVDRNNDGTINSDDLYRAYNSDPKTFLGISSSLNFQKWTAGFSARANFGNYVYNNTFSNTGITRNIFNPLGYLNNGSTNVLESNLSGDINGDKLYLSDYYLENASFLRMDNINVGYSFGQVYKGASLSVNANVNNVFVITKYKGVDPEISGGIDNSFYPRPRVFMLGLNLKF
jgi:iron complex outermembrane receptor protein